MDTRAWIRTVKPIITFDFGIRGLFRLVISSRRKRIDIVPDTVNSVYTFDDTIIMCVKTVPCIKFYKEGQHPIIVLPLPLPEKCLKRFDINQKMST